MIINKDVSATLSPSETSDIKNLLEIFAKTEKKEILADVGGYIDVLFLYSKNNKSEKELATELNFYKEKVSAGKLLNLI